MRIYVTMAVVEGEGLSAIDTIEYEGKLWLVPQWIDGLPEKGFSKPARIICLSLLPLVGPTEKETAWDYFLNGSISKAVLDGRVPPELEILYPMIELPDIVVSTPSVKIH